MPRMAAFRPGLSPPAVKMPTYFVILGSLQARQEIVIGSQRRPRPLTDRDQDLLTEDGRHITRREQAWARRRVALVDPDKAGRIEPHQLPHDAAVRN